MDAPEDHTRPQKEGSFPEKPLERDTNRGMGSKESLKVKKPSKFKSIFTKSKRNAPPDSLVAAIGPLDERTGEGDNKNDNTQKDQQFGGGKQFTPKSDPFKVKDSQLVFPSPANLVKEENVPVQIHNDPFLVRNAPEVSIENVPRVNTAPSLLVVPDPTHVVADERTPKRPQPQFKSKEGRKSVTMMSTLKGSKGEHSRNHHHHHQDAKKVAVRKNHAPISGSREKVEQSEHLDSRHLKRHNVKMKEKAKSRELLALVEELAYNCEYYKSALNRREDRQEAESYQLRKENESLNLQIFKLGQEIEEWKEKCQKMENRSTALSKAKSLTKENKDLLDDLEVLKSVICRLNRELSYYQDKLRSKYKDSPENIDTYSTSSSGTGMEEGDATPPSKEWLNQPRKSLLPLLVSYDEVIADKEEIIKDHEIALDRFKSKCMHVIKENDDLHKLISDNKDRGTISLDEWESLRVNAVLVLEENDILHNQVDTLRRKEEKLFSTFQGKATGFKQTIDNLESELRKQVSAVADLETRCKRLTEENTNLNGDLQTKIPREKHNSMVHEFKQAFEELKSKYDSDKKTLNEKVTSVEKERERLVGEVTTLESENARLRTDVQDCENNLAANTLSLQKMKTSMLEQTSAREATNNVIEDFMVHVQQLVAEKNKIVGDLNEQKLVNEQIMALRTKENELVSDLHGKIEAMERLHNEETKRMQVRLKEMEETLRTQSERHRREKAQFSELLGEKDKRIESIETEKRQLQQDLETVWRTTTTTMQNTIKGRPN